MPKLSDRAESLFKPGDTSASREQRGDWALMRLAAAGCPPFPEFVHFMTTYAGGSLLLEGGEGAYEFHFSALVDKLLLTRFGDREICDANWLHNCRAEHLPGGRDPNDWDLQVGGMDTSWIDTVMWADGTIRNYYAGFAWSRPIATTIEGFLEHMAFCEEAFRQGYQYDLAAVANKNDAKCIINRFNLRADPYCNDPLCPGWIGPSLRLSIQASSFNLPRLYGLDIVDIRWDPAFHSQHEIREILQRLSSLQPLPNS